MALRFRGTAVGALILLALSGCSNGPNPAMVDTARSLVPPEATITDFGENTGSHVIVGDYFAVVDFDDGGLGTEGLIAAIADRADTGAWILVEREELAGGTQLVYARYGLQARITVFTASPSVYARIKLSRD